MSVARRVYVISDLHLGGKAGADGRQRGFRIFTHATELASFVDSLRTPASPGWEIELIINGDFVDFLAELDPETGNWTALKSPAAAISILNMISRPEREGAVFDALGQFLKAGHRLTLLLGNHDIELSFPDVRRALRRILRADRNSDINFIFDGEAYVIGNVLIEHGNRYDAFNVNDYDALRRTRSLHSRRIIPDKSQRLKPTPGSDLVTSVINPLKESYPFVDLLKPETEAVVPLLLAIDPSCRKYILTAAMHAYRARSHRMRTPVIGAAPGDISAAPDFSTLDSILGRILENGEKVAFQDAIDEELVADTENAARDIAFVRDSRPYIGLLQLLLQDDSTSLRKRVRALLIALRAMQGHDYFNRSVEPTGAYYEAIEEFGNLGFEVVIFGHTHVARDTVIGRTRYLNTGTWADSLRFPDVILGSSDDVALASLETFLILLRDRERFDERLRSGTAGAAIHFEPEFAALEFDEHDRLLSASLLPSASRN